MGPYQQQRYKSLRIGPFDPHAGFVAGDDLRLAKDGLRLIGLDLEPRINSVV